MPSDMPDLAVCVYCASGPTHPELLALAERLGAEIADRGWTLVSGGGNVSAMGAVAHGARSRGGRTVGVIPKALVHRELADVDADELIVTDTMRQRKQVMEDRADAFIALIREAVRAFQTHHFSGRRQAYTVFGAATASAPAAGTLDQRTITAIIEVWWAARTEMP